MATHQSSLDMGEADFRKHVLKMLEAILPEISATKSAVEQLRSDVDSLREFQIDQERERHSLLLSGNFAGRNAALQPREPQLTLSGVNFKTTTKQLKPRSIY
jgi:hypothetical protein